MQGHCLGLLRFNDSGVSGNTTISEDLSSRGVDERASVSDQQMRNHDPLYPVDRYLVESSKKIDIVKILDDENWCEESALRPEDELVLRKLQDMLQSTADDLKILSGELAKYHEPGVQIKSTPTPLDQDFNEKVHIEEVVNAKFHGYKIIDNNTAPKTSKVNVIKELIEKEVRKPKFKSTGVQVKLKEEPVPNPILKKPRTNKTNINSETFAKDTIESTRNTKPSCSISYNEVEYKYVEQEKSNHKLKLNIQEMPSINIRSALLEQKVVQLDIQPQIDNSKGQTNKNNTVIEVKHVPIEISDAGPPHKHVSIDQKYICASPHRVRKVTKMSTCESSESTSNPSADIRISKKNANENSKKKTQTTRQKVTSKLEERKKKECSNINDWRKKLNSVYGASTCKNKLPPKPNINSKKLTDKTKDRVPTLTLNNAEYIPYTKLTLGGANVSDVEREIAVTDYRNDTPLSPLINQILTRENSFNSPRNDKVLNTSDENLLQEVLDIEKCISESISKNIKESKADKKVNNNAEDNVNLESYDDDFESENNKAESGGSNKDTSNQDTANSDNYENDFEDDTDNNIANKSLTKKTNLSFKEQIDIFEFIHAVDTQDNATQSVTRKAISLKETQTSPRHSKADAKPIHNDLWPSKDPHIEIEKLLTLEKDLIRKIILEEYGDLLSKPSTSKQHEETTNRNISALPKNTQTSPARVKNVMTSPTLTKTRTTSPFLNPPSIINTSLFEDGKSTENDDPGISINLSSPRFSLHLPQTSKEALSNLEIKFSTNTSSADVESSSELSSLGEIRLRRRVNRKCRVATISESSSTSVTSKSSVEVLSSGHVVNRSVNNIGKSEGEISTGQIKSEGEVSFK